jgi:hypothetical protein
MRAIEGNDVRSCFAHRHRSVERGRDVHLAISIFRFNHSDNRKVRNRAKCPDAFSTFSPQATGAAAKHRGGHPRDCAYMVHWIAGIRLTRDNELPSQGRE